MSKVEVRVRGLALGQVAPLVLLVPFDCEAPLIYEPEREAETDYCVDRALVPQGKYTLSILFVEEKDSSANKDADNS
jgi:hypothetical protein